MEQNRLKKIIADMNDKQSPLLQVLLAVQDANPKNYVSEEAIRQISAELKISRSRVYSTASFYSEISLNPRGENIIRVCSNAPCENAGKKEILEEIKSLLKIDIGETTKDQSFTLESVNCLGGCYMSPSIKINDQIFGNLSPEDIPGIIALYKKECVCNETA